MIEDIKELVRKKFEFGIKVKDESPTDYIREYWVGYTDSLGELLELLDELNGDMNVSTR